MNLKMTGIDFTRAGIDIRQRFSFTRNAMAEAMEQLKQKQEIRGCVLISTCNRMELWLSLKEGASLSLPQILCSLKGLAWEEYGRYLVTRESKEAVKHLFYLSAGMKSQIVGEDQILTQVKEAISFAREKECADKILQVLFRMAVTAGKQVKSCVVMDKANFSAAHQAVDFFKEQGTVFAGKKCLVIGNGEMGKLTAQSLMEEGADVTVTVRQFKSGMVQIPQGAKRIDYGQRYHHISGCDMIFSATASPNVTITRQMLADCLADCEDRKVADKKRIFVDLAVPRDMETSIAEMENVEYYDMDSLPIRTQSPEMRSQYRQAEEILTEEIRKFMVWQECRDINPRIQQIGMEAAEELVWRMERPLSGLCLSGENKERLQQQLRQTAGKVVDKLLFELRDQAEQEVLQKTVEIMEQVYRKDRMTMELWDIYDENRQRTGRTMRRNDWTMKEGEYHLTVLGVLMRPDGKFLITKRVETKAWAPGWWEVSGGAAMAGEESREAVNREVFEETGIDVSGCEDGYLFTYQRENPREGDNYFVDVYRFVVDFQEDDVHLQEKETAGFQIADKEEIEKLAAQGIFLHYDSIKRAFSVS